MGKYVDYTKEQLITRIEELEKQLEHLNSEKRPSNLKKIYGEKILEVLPDMLSVFDRDYNYVALASSEATVHVGNSSQDLIGKNLAEILPPDAYKPVKENFDIVQEEGKTSIGFHNLYVNGKLEHFENRVIPLGDEHILCICRNISDSVKAQNRLQMITSAVNNSLEEIYAARTDGNLVFANKQFINNYGLTNPVTSYKVYNIYQEIGEKEWEEYMLRIRQSGGSLNFSSSHIQADGREIPQEISAYILKDSLNNEIVWTIARDVSERIEQEKKIHELNQLMETILNNIPVYLFVKDTGKDFRYIYWNREVEKMSHLPASQVLGKTDEEIFPDRQDALYFRQDDLKLMEQNGRLEFEESYLTATGERRIVHTIKTLIPLEGRAPLLMGISWDITKQKITEEELIQARHRAEESDKLKSAFLANMSHEIRTPLNAIVGFSKLIAEAEDEIERSEYFDIIDKNAELLLQLINDILDLSKIEAGTLEFVYKPIDLVELCQQIYNIFLPRTSPNVRFILKPNLPPLTIRCDGNRLAQVLSNLITNAQKFTKQGEIHFGYELKEREVEFYVKDTGIGIPRERQNQVFNRFVKLNNFAQGTGLGLAICQMIIENLGGHIGVESEENKGSVFYFTIPYRLEENENQSGGTKKHSDINRAKIEKKQAKILIAEDNDSNYQLLQVLLGKNYQLLHAVNGIETIRLFEQEAPDLILMDIKMPEMNGIEATQRIRQKSPDIPIIALTAFAFDSDKTQALDAGCNDFLTKPIAATILHKTLEKYI